MKTAIALIVVVFLLGLQMADNERAMERCQTTHSTDVCEFTLK